MNIKNILAMICVSLVLLPSVTRTMEQTSATEEQELAVTLAASAQEHELLADLAILQAGQDGDLAGIREEAELAEAFWLSARQHEVDAKQMQEAADFELAKKLDAAENAPTPAPVVVPVSAPTPAPVIAIASVPQVAPSAKKRCKGNRRSQSACKQKRSAKCVAIRQKYK
jgi:hypothetical protein